jgi:hypothetical protein
VASLARLGDPNGWPMESCGPSTPLVWARLEPALTVTQPLLWVGTGSDLWDTSGVATVEEWLPWEWKDWSLGAGWGVLMCGTVDGVD